MPAGLAPVFFQAPLQICLILQKEKVLLKRKRFTYLFLKCQKVLGTTPQWRSFFSKAAGSSVTTFL